MRRLAHERASRARVFLMAGHRGDSVVEDVYDDRGLVDYRVDEAGDAGVEECRVAYDGEDLFIAARALDGFTEADAAGDACAHADDRVGDGERRDDAESVAADVSCYDYVFIFADFVEESAVRASGAEDWRTRRDVRVYRVAAGLLRLGEEGAAHALRRQLVYPRKFLASRAGDAEGFYEVLKVGLVLLDDVERLDGGGEVADFLLRQRPGEAELEV